MGRISAMNKGFLNRYRTIYTNVKNRLESHIDLDNAAGLDFGCGDGTSLLRFALEHPESRFYGVDIDDTFHRIPQNLKVELDCDDVPKNLSVAQIEPGAKLDFDDNIFDFIYSWSVFEHVNRDLMKEVISDIHRVLNARGFLFLQINPLFFSARGAHLYNILPEPWVHLIEQHDNLEARLFGSLKPTDREYMFHP
jgi:SAM-dependent methyltransferase